MGRPKPRLTKSKKRNAMKNIAKAGAEARWAKYKVTSIRES